MKTSSRILVLFFAILVTSILTPISETVASEPSAAEATLKSFPGSSPLVIPAAAFSSNGNYPTSTLFWYSSGRLTGVDPVGQGCVQAPAYLPDNVEITGFFVSYIDNDAYRDFWVWLTRTSNTSTASPVDVATIVTSGDDPDVRTAYASEILEPQVNLPHNSFYVSTCLPLASTGLISARIYYEATDAIFIDGFENGTTSAWTEVTP